MKYSRIIGTGGYLPSQVLTNADLAKIVDTTDEWIVDRTGIKSRRVMAPDETTIAMAEIASKRAIEASGIDKNKIQMIIVATCTPHSLFPNTASSLQNLLGITATACPAFDINVACSGFIYALSIADQYIRSGAIECALVVGADSLTKFVDWSDRTTCILFSDGAGAVVLQADDKPGVYSTHLHTDGSYGNLLYISGNTSNISENQYIKMQGNEVFKVAVTKLGDVVDEALAFNNVNQSDIDWLIPHQANLRIIKATAKRLGLPMERVILTIEDQGNTSAASVPLALDIGVRDGRVKPGDLILLEAFSAGFAWGAALVRF
ncbi:MAG TPA: 3-oxoacyl-ACP synthase [Coxiellaceae bacterium]|nr:MAG: 3-oxoacyl-ACP synthase [Gammaproteobacteria bacterium RBG_16_37_9]HBC71154.1 3-oxoacyl-ACP synthase [Coxiellaceae bacterium]